MNKFYMNGKLIHKASDHNTKRCEVEKWVFLPHSDFERLKANPYQEHEAITVAKKLMYEDKNAYHCIMLLDEHGDDGLLIEADGFDYPRYSMFVPDAKSIYERYMTSEPELTLHDMIKDTHVRRYWVNALPKEKSAYETSEAAKGVDFCNRIYHEEKLLTELNAEERYEQRLVKIKPLLDAFFAWAEELKVSGKNKLVDAVRYTLNEKKYLYTFLEDGDVPIDNNRAENAIRPFTVGRKNWLFNNTERGAKCSALLYSIISTAQANGMDVEKYLTDLFSNLAGTILMPWNN